MNAIPPNDEEPPFVILLADEHPSEAIPVVQLVEPAVAARFQRADSSSVLRVLGWIAAAWEWLFGTLVLLLALAVLAAIPVVQLLSFGYLLEVSGRIGRSGRLRDGFIGYRQAARIGSILLGAALVVVPLQLFSSLWLSAELIEPGGITAKVWKGLLLFLTFLAAIHIGLACARGGRLRHFLFPFVNPFWFVWRLWQGGYFTQARDAVWDFLISLRLPYYFWLGLRGFVGSFLWLAIPVTMLAAGRKVPPLGVLGWFLLIAVLLYVPFLQVHFAAQNRFRALFAIASVRSHFRRAPWAFALAFFVSLSFALPLYLLKIEMIQREAAWLPNLVFIAFIYPARLLTGWAYGRAEHRAFPRHWLFRWTGRFTMLVLAGLYGVVVYFTQFVAWGGIWSLYEQHAFLLPVPFFSM
jgi:hypothetical protein